MFKGPIFLLLLPIILAIFFLPTLIALNDKHRTFIFALNVLGVVTVLTWFVALGLNVLGSFIVLSWFVALGWALFFRRPRLVFRTRKAKPTAKKDRKSFLLILLKVQSSQNTIASIQQKTSWPKAEIVKLVDKMVKDKLLVEELDMYSGHWYYYVNPHDESAHLNIHQRKKKKM